MKATELFPVAKNAIAPKQKIREMILATVTKIRIWLTSMSCFVNGPWLKYNENDEYCQKWSDNPE